MRQMTVSDYLLFRVNRILFTPVSVHTLAAVRIELELMRIYVGFHLGGKN